MRRMYVCTCMWYNCNLNLLQPTYSRTEHALSGRVEEVVRGPNYAFGSDKILNERYR